MLFSATQTKKVDDLVQMALHKEPIFVGVDDQSDMATVEGLQQVSAAFRLTDFLLVMGQIFLNLGIPFI
jgi:superfamily II DNA/RNA helicase